MDTRDKRTGGVMNFEDLVKMVFKNSGISIYFKDKFPSSFMLSVMHEGAEGGYGYPVTGHEFIAVYSLAINMDSSRPFHVLLHELSHATGHSSRLSRPSLCPLAYRANITNRAFEEIVAELSASHLMELLNFTDSSSKKFTKAYLNKWKVDLMQGSGLNFIPSSFMQDMEDAASEASKYILDNWIDINEIKKAA